MRAENENGRPASPRAGRQSGCSRTDSTAADSARPRHSPQPVPAWQPVPVAALPDAIQAFVNVSAQAIGCDPSYVLLPLLSALAAAIGNTRQIRLKKGWDEPAILWTAIVGDSGAQKSPAQDAALRPLYRRQAEVIRRYQSERERFEKQQEEYRADRQEWMRKGHKNGEPPPDAPQPPVCERRIVSDITIEALADRLDENPRGLLLARDELRGWFGSFDQYKAGKGSDASHWLALYHGRELLVDRKSGDKTTTYVRRASVSVTGGIQPEILRQALGREHFEDGLAARLQVAFPPRRARRWTEAEIGEAEQDSLSALFDRLLELEPDVDSEGQQFPHTVYFDSAAKDLWVDFYNRHGAEQSELSGDLAAAFAKLEAVCARLALILHLTRWAAGEAVAPDAVDRKSVKAAVELTEWFKHETQRVYALLSEGDEARERRQLVEIVERKGGRVTPRDLTRSSRKYQTAEIAEEALRDLQKAGFGEFVSVPTNGRPRKEFRLSTNVDVDRSPSNRGKNDLLSTSTPSTAQKMQSEDERERFDI